MKNKTKATLSSRRKFLKTSLGAAVAAGFPTIVPSSVFALSQCVPPSPVWKM